MQNFLMQLGHILYPKASDQEIMDTINELKKAHPKEDEQMLALGVVEHFINGEK